MAFKVEVRDRILRPLPAVFEAWIDPTHMSNYFISSASAPIRQGERVEWSFDDVNAKFSVDILEVVENKLIVFSWAASGSKHDVGVLFEPDVDDSTVVKITESSFNEDADGIKQGLGQNAGWTHLLCCLKAYLQFGINLRKGANKRSTDMS
ncbi:MULTISPECIES: SRPBCC domain-containing protein [Acidobacteriaceae]|uniref:SRPBCC domain-containing protein n=1 Tax=Acidobacteriaceae TaxID=204434 RepID=UPI00131CBF8C|nr:MULTISPECIES: SRPBCC domain-containing protein [Acidobacteriaceae]MDW5266971.1 SRPBCC domain-containing protein [Edaphobacter sp.]